MIVDEGKTFLLNLQVATLELCNVHLMASNVTITAATVVADLTEPVFTGYAPVAVGDLTDSGIVAGRATRTAVVSPVFTNSGGTAATVWGWFVTDDTDATLVSAVNFGSTSIPAGQSLSLQLKFTDTQE